MTVLKRSNTSWVYAYEGPGEEKNGRLREVANNLQYCMAKDLKAEATGYWGFSKTVHWE
jgi:hypothetical protein